MQPFRYTIPECDKRQTDRRTNNDNRTMWFNTVTSWRRRVHLPVSQNSRSINTGQYHLWRQQDFPVHLVVKLFIFFVKYYTEKNAACVKKGSFQDETGMIRGTRAGGNQTEVYGGTDRIFLDAKPVYGRWTVWVIHTLSENAGRTAQLGESLV